MKKHYSMLCGLSLIIGAATGVIVNSSTQTKSQYQGQKLYSYQLKPHTIP